MEKRGGHIIKCLLTELGRAGRANHGAQTSLRSVRTSGQIFSRPARPNFVNKYILFFLSPPTIWSICDAVVSEVVD